MEKPNRLISWIDRWRVVMLSVMVAVQCWCRSDGRVHLAEYRAGTHEVRRRRRHVSDRQHAAHTATVHGPVRGSLSAKAGQS